MCTMVPLVFPLHLSACISSRFCDNVIFCTRVRTYQWYHGTRTMVLEYHGSTRVCTIGTYHGTYRTCVLQYPMVIIVHGRYYVHVYVSMCSTYVVHTCAVPRQLSGSHVGSSTWKAQKRPGAAHHQAPSLRHANNCGRSRVSPRAVCGRRGAALGASQGS